MSIVCAATYQPLPEDRTKPYVTLWPDQHFGEATTRPVVVVRDPSTEREQIAPGYSRGLAPCVRGGNAADWAQKLAVKLDLPCDVRRAI